MKKRTSHHVTTAVIVVVLAGGSYLAIQYVSGLTNYKANIKNDASKAREAGDKQRAADLRKTYRLAELAGKPVPKAQQERELALYGGEGDIGELDIKRLVELRPLLKSGKATAEQKAEAKEVSDRLMTRYPELAGEQKTPAEWKVIFSRYPELKPLSE